MGDVLEKLLDEIIGENNKPLRPPKKLAGKSLRGQGDKLRRGQARTRSPPVNKGVPHEINRLCHGRPVLRVKNIHPDLNGEDLSNLFGEILPVDFVKFDAVDDTVAYVCFQSDNKRSNGRAVEKYDGRKAMGRVITVEVPGALLMERIGGGAGGNRPTHRSREATPAGGDRAKKPRQRRERRERRPRPESKLAEALDDELSAYMAQGEKMETD